MNGTAYAACNVRLRRPFSVSKWTCLGESLPQRFFMLCEHLSETTL